MNINQRFLEEAKALEGRWAKLGLLDGMKDRYSRQSTAVLMECERLINEVSDQESDKCPLREGGTCPVQLRGDCPNDGKCSESTK